MTEAEEFGDIYKLEVIEIPTNEPVRRDDTDDEVYRTTREKYDAVVEQVLECRKRQQPVLVGTVSVEKSEARCQRSSKRNRSRTPSSTPAITSRRRKSSPRRAGPAR